MRNYREALDGTTEALANFRISILTELAKIQCQIETIELALMEEPPLTARRLGQLREKAEKRLRRHRRRYAETIPPAHTLSGHVG